MGTGTNEAPAPGIIVQPQYNDNVANHAGKFELLLGIPLFVRQLTRGPTRPF